MAEGKKSFQLYADLIDFVNGSNVHDVEVEAMTDEEAGKLFRWILEYVNDLHPVIPKEIRFVVAQVKKQLDDELEKWKKKCEINRVNGALGGRPRKPTETQENPNGFLETQNNPEKPDKDKDKDNINNISYILSKDNLYSGANDTPKIQILDETEMMFNQFWKVYPRKSNKKGAFTSFKRIPHLKKVFPEIMSALSIFMESYDWKKNDGQFIPYPQKFINQRRWEDEDIKKIILERIEFERKVDELDNSQSISTFDRIFEEDIH